MNYLEYKFIISPLEPARDILIAELGELGFESFVETETGVDAYVQESVDKEIITALMAYQIPGVNISYNQTEVEDKNWNEEWEKNFNPILVTDKCIIRAPFHEKDETIDLEIIIQPQMSFGTGHHQTTFLISRLLLELDCKDKSVLDMGCGTGVLAIIAEKRGAIAIDAIDYDEWSYRNTLENVELNDCHRIKSYHGDAALLIDQEYDLILANINRNILLKDMVNYNKVLKNGGEIVFSGFYEQDAEMIIQEASKYGISLLSMNSKEKWAMLRMKKD